MRVWSYTNDTKNRERKKYHKRYFSLILRDLMPVLQWITISYNYRWVYLCLIAWCLSMVNLCPLVSTYVIVFFWKDALDQWFSNLSWGPPATAYFVCLPHLTHLIQLISSLVESARLEMGVAYERDIQNVWWLGVPRTGLRTTALDHVQ